VNIKFILEQKPGANRGILEAHANAAKDPDAKCLPQLLFYLDYSELITVSQFAAGGNFAQTAAVRAGLLIEDAKRIVFDRVNGFGQCCERDCENTCCTITFCLL